jgi:TldD protein
MNQSLALAKKQILEPAGLADQAIDLALDIILCHTVDAADLYFQWSRSESWILEDGIVKSGTHGIEQGVGVRAISGEKTGFSYTDEVTQPALTRAATAARAIARSGGSGQVKTHQQLTHGALYAGTDPLARHPERERIALLERIDAEARREDPRITQVVASLTANYKVVLIAASDGTYTSDIRPLVRLNVQVIAEHKGRREQGTAGGGGRHDYAYFLAEQRGLQYARKAVRQALVNLEAIPAPAGTFTVVLGPGWPGVLLHEAIGHGLEGDFNRKGTSAFSGRLGERVATEHCTVVDDGTLANRRGSLNVDDEGTPSQCTPLIERGILKGYLQDKLNARLMHMAPTGNGRRESYAHLPLPRMTNTYMLPGPHSPEEIIASVSQGLYAVNFGGGQVDITSGKFVFSASEAYLIENGRLTRPVKGATLIGNGPDVLTRVSMVGNDLQLDEGIGTCGKEGQSVPVGVGQPTLRIEGLAVGGTQIR